MGLWSIKCDTSDIKTSQFTVVNDDWDVDGIITTICNRKTIDKIINSGIPAVFCVDKIIPGYPNIQNEDTKIGNMAADYLMNLGLQNFAFCGYSDILWSQDRGKGFKEKLSENGFDLNVYEGKSYKN